jgi:hypothetical protein
MESIVRNTLRDDPAALAEWQVARHVTKVRVSKAAKPPAAPVPPVPPVQPTEERGGAGIKPAATSPAVMGS